MSMTESPSGDRRSKRYPPLGYLVKRLDEALTSYVDRLLGERHQLGRFHWQVLTTVHEQPGIEQGVFAEEARIFYDEERLNELIGDLVGRGWLRVDAQVGTVRLWLTDEGEVGHRQMRRTQEESSTRLMLGLTEEDYITMVTHLDRMIANLEQPPST